MASGTEQTMPAPPTWSQPMEVTTPQQPLVINPQTLSRQGSPYSSQEPPYPFAETTSLPDNVKLQSGNRVRRRSFGGCLLRLTLVLVLLFAALTGVWFFVVQPNLHAFVINKLDNSMTQAVDKIPALPKQPSLPFPIRRPSNVTVPIPDTLLENFLENSMKLNMAPSDPVQDPVVIVNEQGVRLEFNVHFNFLPINFPCAVSFLPVIDAQGNLVAQNVNIEGIANLALSSDELTNLLNKHFADALAKLDHPLSKIDFQQRQVVLTLK